MCATMRSWWTNSHLHTQHTCKLFTVYILQSIYVSMSECVCQHHAHHSFDWSKIERYICGLVKTTKYQKSAMFLSSTSNSISFGSVTSYVHLCPCRWFSFSFHFRNRWDFVALMLTIYSYYDKNCRNRFQVNRTPKPQTHFMMTKIGSFDIYKCVCVYFTFILVFVVFLFRLFFSLFFVWRWKRKHSKCFVNVTWAWNAA